MIYLNSKEKKITNKFLSQGYIINTSKKSSKIYIDNLYQQILKKIFKSKKKN